MKKRILLFAMAVALTTATAYAVGPGEGHAEILPDGDMGIAAQYPGDAGIEAHPDIILFDDFENYSVAGDLPMIFRSGSGTGKGDKWFSINSSHGEIKVVNDTVGAAAGNKYLEFFMPQRSGETSMEVRKRFLSASQIHSQTPQIKPEPKHDIIFVRSYVKYSENFDVLGSCHNGFSVSGGYTRFNYDPWGDYSEATPGERANGTNKFLVNWEHWRHRDDPTIPNPGLLNFYVYHPEQREGFGDQFFPTGMVFSYSSNKYDFGNEFTRFPDFIPELGQWYCYEMMVKLNTPGKRDGRISLWIDGALMADYPQMRLRDTAALQIDYVYFGFHAGSNANGPASVYYDNIVMAKSYIGPIAEVQP